MRQHRNNFRLFRLFNQGVEEDDLFRPGKAGEVGVGVGGALGAVDYLEFGEGEGEAGGEAFDGGFERAGGERGEFVEDGDDEDRVEGY